MEELILYPRAHALLNSVRSVGYSLETAIADLIDNSISAGATKISVRYSPNDAPYVAVLDDGSGMTPEELNSAMRHGSKDPCDIRTANDLGRFGLGLKTASLSQCRKFTVISLKERILSGRCWDLDLIAARKDWILCALTREEMAQLPLVDVLLRQGKGTVVLWQHLDRIEAGESSIERALSEKMDLVREHLALVFHRYIEGERGLDRIEIRLNENPVNAHDPFFKWHPATQPLQEERLTIQGHRILVKPYILPHISKLSADELRQAGGEESLRRYQGFYIYRNRRLIIWGTWFRLTRQQELSKLARVRVDIPNALDHLWTLDIKKSAAHPPEEVRLNLRRIVEKIVGTSRRVYTFRGRKANNDKLTHTWNRMEGRDGICYIINRDHPAITLFRNRLDEDSRQLLEIVLDTIERTYPVDALYADMASDRPQYFDEKNLKEKLIELARNLLAVTTDIEGGRDRLLQALPSLDPFCLYPNVTETIIKELSDAR